MTQAKPEPGQTSTPIDIKDDKRTEREKDPRAELGLTSPIKDADDKSKSKESRNDQ
ncbi:hypothetical protein [Allopusillimonas ginsengisoli]|uniref:hypothetical protein n=1 Tax=Allopusillimonas ginsengisoli TaxID=453575 RepID=UPI00142F629C|nr:hypothetical protein [Allopusillimonas ginsengisoli]